MRPSGTEISRPLNPDSPVGMSHDQSHRERILPGFAALVLDRETGVIRGAARNGQPEPHIFEVPFDPRSSLPEYTVRSVMRELRKVGNGNTDWRGVGASNFDGTLRALATHSWMEHQTPWYKSKEEIEDPSQLLRHVIESHTPVYGRPQVVIGPDRQVQFSKLGKFTDQMSILPEKVAHEYTRMTDNIAKALHDHNVVTISGNTTAVAGGVAQMNAELYRFVEDRNEDVRERRARGEEAHELDFRWVIAGPQIDKNIARDDFGIDLDDEATREKLLKKYGEIDPEHPDDLMKRKLNIFRLTKARHNALQNVEQPGYEYTELDDRLYHAWCKTQWEQTYKRVIGDLIAERKKVVFKPEDQQMFGMLPYMLQDFPKDKYPQLLTDPRLHIHVYAELARDTSTPKGKIAASILKDLNGIDAFISHISRPQNPNEFLFQDRDGNVHPTIRDITVMAPASMDITTGNRIKMNPEKKALVRAENRDYLRSTGQSDEYFDLEAYGDTNRWDRSKAKWVGILAHALHVEDQLAKGVPLNKILQFRSVGMTPTDDPEGKLIHAAYMLGIHPEFINRPEFADYARWVDTSNPNKLKPKDLTDLKRIPEDEDPTRFQPMDWDVIAKLNEVVIRNPAYKKKVELYRFNYVEHDDMQRNAVEDSRIADVHSSPSEACEDNIAGHMSQGRLVWIADAGGAPNQGKEGITAHIFKPFDYRDVANGMNDFYTEVYLYPDLHRSVRRGIAANVKPEYTTPYNVIKVFGMSALLAVDGPERFRQKVINYRDTHNGNYPFVHHLLTDFIMNQPDGDSANAKFPGETLVFAA